MVVAPPAAEPDSWRCWRKQAPCCVFGHLEKEQDSRADGEVKKSAFPSARQRRDLCYAICEKDLHFLSEAILTFLTCYLLPEAFTRARGEILDIKFKSDSIRLIRPL